MTHRKSTRLGSVLLVDLAIGFGGAEARVIDTASHLESELYCSVAVIHGSPLHQRAMAAGLRVRPIPMRRSDPRLIGALRQIIRDEEISVLDAHNVQSQLWGHLASRAEGIPGLVSTVHSEYRVENPGVKGWAHEQVLRRNATWGCTFIAVSGGIERYLRGLTGHGTHIELIRRGFPVVVPSPVTEIRRTDIGWSEDDVVIGVVGRLATAKGHAVLLDALMKIRDTTPQLRCYIAGSGDQMQAIEAKSRRLRLGDVVHLAGYSSDLGAIFDLIDVLCLPSLTEGLPNVVLEAVSRHVPVVATAVGEIPEILADGRDAWLVAPGDAHGLARALTTAATAPEERRKRAESAALALSEKLTDDWLGRTVRVYEGAGAQIMG